MLWSLGFRQVGPGWAGSKGVPSIQGIVSSIQASIFYYLAGLECMR